MSKDLFVKCRSSFQGFSLIELLVVLSILSIVLLIAVPDFSVARSSSQLASTRGEFHNLLAFARLSSINHGYAAVVCSWDGGDGCTGSSNSNQVEWKTGALLFLDKNADRKLDLESEEVLKIVEVNPNTSVIWNRGETLAFEPDGSAKGGSNGTFRFSNQQLETKLVLSLAGRIRRSE